MKKSHFLFYLDTTVFQSSWVWKAQILQWVFQAHFTHELSNLVDLMMLELKISSWSWSSFLYFSNQNQLWWRQLLKGLTELQKENIFYRKSFIVHSDKENWSQLRMTWGYQTKSEKESVHYKRLWEYCDIGNIDQI